MRIKGIIALIALLTAVYLLTSGQSNASGKIVISPEALQHDSLKVWIFFTDKGESIGSLSKPAAISDHAIARRALRGTTNDAAELDRQVSNDYIDQVRPFVRKVVQQSRWLNAISVVVDRNQLDNISALESVREIRQVAKFTRPNEGVLEQGTLPKPSAPFPPDYGESYPQLNQVQIPELHNLGYKGDGIRVLMLDTGFDTAHPAFANTDIEATRDFINGDDDVRDENDSQRDHGTSTLSIVGATDVGNMLGAAYEATFLLAKTEVRASETQIEEDYWVSGIEWGEGLGCDVASSSLGYTNWYSYMDFDGNTAVTTIAADIAASLGVIVVNSVGNSGHVSEEPTLGAPSDGDSVIAVGAVDAGGIITNFSSNGPSYDGRIKPDVCALGAGNRVASYATLGYSFGSGTSFSCPIVAGAVALLLQAHPDWTYGDICDALTSTATRAASPDNLYGYGIIRTRFAVDYQNGNGGKLKGIVAYPNPFANEIDFDFETPPSGPVEIRIYTVAGEKIATIRRESGDTAPLHWDGKNQDGEVAAAGVYVVHISAEGISENRKIMKSAS